MLISNAMEIEEAARSGLTVYSTEDFGESELMRTFRDDPDGRQVAYYRRVFDRLGVAGRVGGGPAHGAGGGVVRRRGRGPSVGGRGGPGSVALWAGAAGPA